MKVLDKKFTIDEYLEKERLSDSRSEFIAGEVYPLTGASFIHNLIVSNLSHLLTQLLDESYYVMTTDLKLWIPAKQAFVYPDVMVISGEPEFQADNQDILTNPICVIEVLSESTKNYYRGEKFEMYRSVPSIQEYILVDQERIHIEQFIRKERFNWELMEYTAVENTFQSNSLKMNLKIPSIYNRVKNV